MSSYLISKLICPKILYDVEWSEVNYVLIYIKHLKHIRHIQSRKLYDFIFSQNNIVWEIKRKRGGLGLFTKIF